MSVSSTTILNQSPEQVFHLALLALRSNIEKGSEQASNSNEISLHEAIRWIDAAVPLTVIDVIQNNHNQSLSVGMLVAQLQPFLDTLSQIEIPAVQKAVLLFGKQFPESLTTNEANWSWKLKSLWMADQYSPSLSTDLWNFLCIQPEAKLVEMWEKNKNPEIRKYLEFAIRIQNLSPANEELTLTLQNEATSSFAKNEDNYVVCKEFSMLASIPKDIPILFEVKEENLTEEKVKRINKVLKENRSIISLFLDTSEVDFGGGNALADIISKNKSLRSLSLTCDKLGSAVIQIAEAIKKNKTLKSVTFQKDSIDTLFLRELAEAVISNNTLTKLKIGVKQHILDEKKERELISFIKLKMKVNALFRLIKFSEEEGAVWDIVDNKDIHSDSKKVLSNIVEAKRVQRLKIKAIKSDVAEIHSRIREFELALNSEVAALTPIIEQFERPLLAVTACLDQTFQEFQQIESSKLSCQTTTSLKDKVKEVEPMQKLTSHSEAAVEKTIQLTKYSLPMQIQKNNELLGEFSKTRQTQSEGLQTVLAMHTKFIEASEELERLKKRGTRLNKEVQKVFHERVEAYEELERNWFNAISNQQEINASYKFSEAYIFLAKGGLPLPEAYKKESNLPTLSYAIQRLQYLRTEYERLIQLFAVDNEKRLICRNIASLAQLPKTIPAVVEIADKPVSVEEVEDIMTFVLRNRLPVHALSFEKTGLTAVGVSKIIYALKFCGSVQKLNFRGNEFGKEGLKQLIQLIKENKRITTLNLSANKIGSAEVRELADALKENDTLLSLDLSENNIDSIGAKEITEAMKENRTLLFLNLSNNKIDPEAIEELQRTVEKAGTLKELNINDNSAVSGNSTLFVELLREDMGYDVLYFNKKILHHQEIEEIAAILNDGNCPTTLYLIECDLGVEEIRKLSPTLKKNKILKKLYLSKNNLGVDGGIEIAALIRENHHLTVLDISDCNIGEGGGIAVAESLRGNHGLKILNLGGNNLGSTGAIAIANSQRRNSALSSLHLNNNNIEIEGLKEIAEMLKENDTLTLLNLDHNGITHIGAKVIAEALKEVRKLTHMYVAENEIGCRGVELISEALTVDGPLILLDLSKNDIDSFAGQKFVQALKENSTLAVLNLERNQIEESVLNAVEDAIRLNRRGDGYKKIIWSNLEEQPLQEENTITNFFKKLNKTVKKIKMQMDWIDEEWCELEDLLSIEDDPIKRATLVQQKNRSIVKGTQQFWSYLLSIEAPILLALWKRQEYEKIKGCFLLALFKQNFMTDDKDLQNALKSVKDSIFIQEGGAILCRDLATLSSFPIYVPFELRLFRKNLTTEDIEILANQLKKSICFTKLSLVDCNIDAVKVKVLTEALAQNRTVQVLDLGGNHIGQEGAKEIAKFLCMNKTLLSLHLRENDIDSEGIAEIAKALEENNSLSTLDLWGNLIGIEGAKAIGNLLEKNTFLNSLSLFKCKMRSAEGAEIARGVKCNFCLASLNIDENLMDEALKNTIMTKIKENREGAPEGVTTTLVNMVKDYITPYFGPW